MPKPGVRVHALESSLPPGLDLAEAAARVAPHYEYMLVDSVPVDGKATSLLAISHLYRFEVTDGAPDSLARLMSLLKDIDHSGVRLPAALKSAFGFLGYEAVRGFERLPERHPRIAPDYLFLIPHAIALHDKESGSSRLVAFGHDRAEAAEFASTVQGILAEPAIEMAAKIEGEVEPWLTTEQFSDAVRKAKQYLLDGDIFQVVLSLRLELHGQMPPTSLYRKLVSVNPSPFQFCYQGPEFAVVGASPEPFVEMIAGRATVRPLAGTRPRGQTAEADDRNEQDLRASVKEAAEHRMLVDLARNDLGRVSVPGTVEVDAVMQVERYSHVMHLVSNVVGQLPAGVGAEEVLRACFPAGTMAGAPKVRAMEIIDELEPAARGFYAGAAGLIAPDEIHTYLVIRSAVQRRGRLSLQAGAGIVADSDPAAEYAECLSKLAATATALGIPLPRSTP